MILKKYRIVQISVDIEQMTGLERRVNRMEEKFDDEKLELHKKQVRKSYVTHKLANKDRMSE
jgi:hypothetical protein